MAWYVDTSALLKLVVAETHSAAMRRWVNAHADSLFASDLLRTEALRAARRHSAEALARTEQWLEVLTLVAVGPHIFDEAAVLEPAELRTLDALHLAAARSIGDDLEGVVTYDVRLDHAAALLGIPVVAPT